MEIPGPWLLPGPSLLPWSLPKQTRGQTLKEKTIFFQVRIQEKRWRFSISKKKKEIIHLSKREWSQGLEGWEQEIVELGIDSPPQHVRRSAVQRQALRLLKVTSGLATCVPVNTLILQVKTYKKGLKGVTQCPFLIFKTLCERISTD